MTHWIKSFSIGSYFFGIIRSDFGVDELNKNMRKDDKCKYNANIRE